jgi:site-specific recombinase XerD
MNLGGMPLTTFLDRIFKATQIHRHTTFLVLPILIDGLLPSSSLEGKASGTIAGHRIKLGRFLGFVGDRPIADISSAEIRQYLDHAKQAYGLSLASVERYKVALQALYRWTVDEGFIEINPMSRIKVAKPETKLVQSLNYNQIQELLNSINGRGIEDYPNKAIVMMLLDEGLRASELSSPKLGDVYVKNGIFRVLGKGRQERLARIGLKAQKALWHYLVRRGDNTCDSLWLNQRGETLTRSGIERMLKKQGEKLGFRLYPHLLRHTFAISFLRNGANTFEVPYALGHTTLEKPRQYCSSPSFDDVYRRHVKASPVGNLKTQHS